MPMWPDLADNGYCFSYLSKALFSPWWKGINTLKRPGSFHSWGHAVLQSFLISQGSQGLLNLDWTLSFELLVRGSPSTLSKMRNHMAAGWFYSSEQIKRYCATRVTSLKPPRVGASRGISRQQHWQKTGPFTKPNHYSSRTRPSSMADVCGWFHCLDLGCFWLLYRLVDRYRNFHRVQGPSLCGFLGTFYVASALTSWLTPG